jgi:hypothetical protein
MGAAEMIEARVIRIMEMAHFHPVLNILPRARKPTTRPTMRFTGIKAKLTGLGIPAITLVRVPAKAPTQGPASMETNTVPMVSRKRGILRIDASWLPTTFTATAIGMIRIAISEKSVFIEYFFSFFASLIQNSFIRYYNKDILISGSLQENKINKLREWFYEEKTDY